MTDSRNEEDLLFQEWKEARSIIARFDEHLVNLRKYGFTLATLLLTADAYITMAGVLSVKPLAIFAAAIVVIVLIFALFLLDQHIRTLQLAATDRAVDIEGKLKLKLTISLRSVAKKWQTTHGGTPVYVIFLFVTGFFGIMALYQYQLGQLGSEASGEWSVSSWKAAWGMVEFKFMVGLCFFFCILTPLYGWFTKRAARVTGDMKKVVKHIPQFPQYISHAANKMIGKESRDE